MATQALKKVVSRSEWKGDRFAKLECGHSIKVPLDEAMPYEAACPLCALEAQKD